MAQIIKGFAGQTDSAHGCSFSEKSPLSAGRGSLILSTLVVGIVAMLTAGCGGGNVGTSSRNVVANQPPVSAPITPLNPSPTPAAPGVGDPHDRITVTVVCPAPDIPEKK